MENLLWILISVSLLYVLLTVLDLQVRYIRSEDGEIFQALFVRLPGYVESYSPEHTIQLKDWVGSSITGMDVQVEGESSPELEAELVLRAIGMATDEYVREKLPDGHWILRKPEQVHRYFSLSAHYRVSPMWPAADD